MKTIETEIRIDTDISYVWNVLMDFDNYPKWNPFIRSIHGEQKTGNRLMVDIKPPGGKEMSFKPEILILNPNREFRWKGKLFIHGLFDGEHFFMLESVGNDQTRFIHGESFSGILVPLLGGMLKKTRNGFQLMNEALKKECEIK